MTRKQTNKRFSNGAFVFASLAGVKPVRPDSLIPLVDRHGLDHDIVPAYAGDRVAVGRAVQASKAGLSKEGLLIRPIKRSSGKLIYGIVKETADVLDERIDHRFESVISWSAEPDPGVICGNHPVARKVADLYAGLRGRVVAEDWSRSITAQLDQLDAARIRSGVFWLAPQRLDSVRHMQAFLSDVGINLIVCDVEAEAAPVVRQAAGLSLVDQLDKLEAEVNAFDGTQKPSVYARRLAEFDKLRKRAGLYRAALGIGVDRTESLLKTLEQRVNTMLDLRSNTVVHRDGTVSSPADGTSNNASTSTAAAPAAPPKKSAPAAPAMVTTLKFAGATFTRKPTTNGEAVFVSDDAGAQKKIGMLERMGIAGKWQTLGTANVCIANSGPVGEKVSIRVKVGKGEDVRSMARSLAALGIDVPKHAEAR